MSTVGAFEPKEMQFGRLGSTGLKVSKFSYGTWLTVGGTVKGDPVKDLIKICYENGINTFDTAEVYSNGQSEIETGRVIKELGINRDELVIITKLYFGTGRKDPNQKGLSRKHLVQGMKASLKRLQMDYVDVVFAHRHDEDTPMEEVVRGFNYLIDQGWTYYWGTSEWTAAQVQEAIGIANRLGLVAPSCEQPHYSLLHREKFEVEMAPIWAQGVGTTIWSPLEFGLLSGKYNDGIPDDSRFVNNKEFFGNRVDELKSDKGKAMIAKLRKLGDFAKKHNVSQAALSLAWAVKNPHVSTVLLGASKPEQIIDNLDALKVKLTDEDMKAINEIMENDPKAEK